MNANGVSDNDVRSHAQRYYQREPALRLSKANRDDGLDRSWLWGVDQLRPGWPSDSVSVNPENDDVLRREMFEILTQFVSRRPVEEEALF